MSDPTARVASAEPGGDQRELVDEIAGDRRIASGRPHGVGTSVAEADATVIDPDDPAVGLDLQPTGVAQRCHDPLAVKRPGERAGAISEKCRLLERFLAGEALHALGQRGEQRVGTFEKAQELGRVGIVADRRLLEGCGGEAGGDQR